MTAYYNEIDPFAAQWLRNLIAAGMIAAGDVDERSITDVQADDLRGYNQCHFFAGIGTWSYALRCAGWDDDRPVWTGSCPCQPFSVAGRREGLADKRHLWPAWFELVRKRRPSVIFGEQVASKDALTWLDAVSADLERARYAFAAFDISAAGVGSPHIRQRTWFVADADGARGEAGISEPAEWEAGHAGVAYDGRRESASAGRRPSNLGLGYAGRDGDREHARKLHGDEAQHGDGSAHGDHASVAAGAASALADADALRQQQQPAARVHGRRDGARCEESAEEGADRAPGNDALRRGAADGDGRPGPTNGFWQDADWLRCRDGKWRPVEPGTFPLAVGIAARVGRLRAYGNAIVAPLAAEVIRAYMETRP